MGKLNESAPATIMQVVEWIFYPLQVSVDQTIGVEVVEATRDTNQLNIGNGNC